MVDHRDLGVDLLARGEILLGEGRVALQVAFGVRKVRLILLLLGRSGVERGLVRPGIDDGQQVALLHLLPLGDRYLQQRTVHLRA